MTQQAFSCVKRLKTSDTGLTWGGAISVHTFMHKNASHTKICSDFNPSCLRNLKTPYPAQTHKHTPNEYQTHKEN